MSACLRNALTQFMGVRSYSRTAENSPFAKLPVRSRSGAIVRVGVISDDLTQGVTQGVTQSSDVVARRVVRYVSSSWRERDILRSSGELIAHYFLRICLNNHSRERLYLSKASSIRMYLSSVISSVIGAIPLASLAHTQKHGLHGLESASECA
jgi:hypothetical protein